MLSKTPLYYIKDKLIKQNINDIKAAKESKSNIRFAGIIKSFKTIKTKKGEPMAFLTLFDDENEIEVTVFPKLYALKFLDIKKNVIYIITGRNDQNGSFIADEMNRWEE